MDSACSSTLMCPVLCIGMTMTIIDLFFDINFVRTGNPKPVRHQLAIPLLMFKNVMVRHN